MTESDPIVVQGLAHDYDEGRTRTPVLAGLNFSVRKGEFLTIIGPSGCGKTTLLNIVAGLIVPTKAERLDVEGARVAGPNPAKVALMFQESGLLYWRTARANVELGLEIQHVAKQERKSRAEHYLGVVGLEGFGDRYPSQLSGGMRQRVALARALVLETPIILMDEPFGALDEQTRLVMSEELSKICATGTKTVVFVTHSLLEAAMLSDRIIVLTSRPAKIRGVVQPQTGRPRSEEEAGEIRKELWSQLREESKSAEVSPAV